MTSVSIFSVPCFTYRMYTDSSFDESRPGRTTVFVEAEDAQSARDAVSCWLSDLSPEQRRLAGNRYLGPAKSTTEVMPADRIPPRAIRVS